MTETKRKPYRKAGAREIVSINEHLGKHLTVDDDTGTCSYVKGWTDAKIAERVNELLMIDWLTERHVERVRVDCWGKLVPAEDARLVAVEDRVSALEQELARLAALRAKDMTATLEPQRDLDA